MFDRRSLDQIGHLLHPLAMSLRGMIARGVATLVNDAMKMQLIQVRGAGETIEGDKGIEHFQPYGFYAVPLTGAEALVLFPNADHGHPVAIAVADRRYRPTGGDPGEVGIYNNVTGCRVRMLPSGDIEINPGPTGEVYVREDGGPAERLVRKSEHDGHTHGAGTFTAPGGGGAVTGVSGGAAAVTGTPVLRG